MGISHPDRGHAHPAAVDLNFIGVGLALREQRDLRGCLGGRPPYRPGLAHRFGNKDEMNRPASVSTMIRHFDRPNP